MFEDFGILFLLFVCGFFIAEFVKLLKDLGWL